MKPIIITTPRTGSTLLCEMLTECSGYKSNLNEFFFATPHGYMPYKIEDGLIKVEPGYITNTSKWNMPMKDVHAERLKLFDTYDPLDYMIKLHSYDLINPRIVEFIKHYDTVIFLERKNISEQILSYCAMMQHSNEGDSFHHTKDSTTITSIHFSEVYADEILLALKIYNRFKRNYKGNNFTIFYEDFMNERNSTFTVKTKYASSNLEELVDNKDEWQLYKETVIEPYERSRDGSTWLR